MFSSAVVPNLSGAPEVAIRARSLYALKSSKVTGLDHFLVKYIKNEAKFVTPMVTHIINLSIIQGKVPGELKQARVIPIFKKGSRFERNNYFNHECFIKSNGKDYI